MRIDREILLKKFCSSGLSRYFGQEEFLFLAWVEAESAANQYALRFEPAGRYGDAPCNISWGLFQIMGYNLCALYGESFADFNFRRFLIDIDRQFDAAVRMLEKCPSKDIVEIFRWWNTGKIIFTQAGDDYVDRINALKERMMHA